tara:strand:- start:715 stop:876 length:162 start_codon:yes stop_codon:yes gene_type:complete
MAGKKDFLKSTWKAPKIVNLTKDEKLFIRKAPSSGDLKRIQINEMRKSGLKIF